MTTNQQQCQSCKQQGLYCANCYLCGGKKTVHPGKMFNRGNFHSECYQCGEGWNSETRMA